MRPVQTSTQNLNLDDIAQTKSKKADNQKQARVSACYSHCGVLHHKHHNSHTFRVSSCTSTLRYYVLEQHDCTGPEAPNTVGSATACYIRTLPHALTM